MQRNTRRHFYYLLWQFRTPHTFGDSPTFPGTTFSSCLVVPLPADLYLPAPELFPPRIGHTPPCDHFPHIPLAIGWGCPTIQLSAVSQWVTCCRHFVSVSQARIFPASTCTSPCLSTPAQFPFWFPSGPPRFFPAQSQILCARTLQEPSFPRADSLAVSSLQLSWGIWCWDATLSFTPLQCSNA